MRSSLNRGVDQFSHGGRTGELAEAAGVSEEELLDFSANINPAGPPPWLGEAIAEGAGRIGVYPDPDAGRAREAAALRYGLGRDRFVFADGADSLIFALPRALGASSCLAPSPSYSGYLRAADRAGLRTSPVPLDPEEEYSLASEGFARRLAETMARATPPALVFLGAPNNPVGGGLERASLLELAGRHPEAFFALDESFAELRGRGSGDDRRPRAQPRRAAIPHEDLGGTRRARRIRLGRAPSRRADARRAARLAPFVLRRGHSGQGARRPRVRLVVGRFRRARRGGLRRGLARFRRNEGPPERGELSPSRVGHAGKRR